MRRITVCVGSACHMKGSHQVIDRLGELIHEHGMDDEVDLAASFCMSQCRGNIGMLVDDRPVTDLTRDTVDDVFEREILGK